MIKKILSIFLVTMSFCNAQMNKQILDFEFEGVMLNGVLNLPEEG